MLTKLNRAVLVEGGWLRYPCDCNSTLKPFIPYHSKWLEQGYPNFFPQRAKTETFSNLWIFCEILCWHFLPKMSNSLQNFPYNQRVRLKAQASGQRHIKSKIFARGGNRCLHTFGHCTYFIFEAKNNNNCGTGNGVFARTFTLDHPPEHMCEAFKNIYIYLHL